MLIALQGRIMDKVNQEFNKIRQDEMLKYVKQHPESELAYAYFLGRKMVSLEIAQSIGKISKGSDV